MKRYWLAVLSGMLFVLLIRCSTSKALYELPVEMKEEVKIEYTKQCDQGQVLYQLNCAKCHTTKIGRREIIPDFTDEQLKGYELRVTNNQHAESLTDETCSEQDLMLIMVFLHYKIKNQPAKK